MNATNLINLISNATDINEVESYLNDEFETAHPRKGVLNAAVHRIGELHLDGQLLGDTKYLDYPNEEEETEEVEIPDVDKMLGMLNIPLHRISDRTKTEMNVFFVKEERGQPAVNVWVQPKYYHENNVMMKKLIKFLSDSAKNQGHFARIHKGEKMLAYLQITWK